MTKLTDMQLVLLTFACQREDGSLLPSPESLGDQAARIRKAVEALIKKGLAAECEGMAAPQAWRNAGDIVIGVIVTDAGRAIIEPPATEESSAEAAEPAAASPTAPAATRPASKQAQVMDLLRREGGASLAEIVELTGWLPHTSRAALTGIRKKGHAVTSAKVEGVTRYQITTAA